MTGLAMVGLGLLLVLLGADSLLRGAAGLLLRSGAGAERTGALLVVLVFWLPQLAITLQALALGYPEFGVEAAIGAGMGNLGLLLGLTALVAPLAAGLQLLPALRVFALIAPGLVMVLARGDGEIVPWEGGVLVAAFIAVAAFVLSRLSAEDAAVRGELGKLAITGQGVVQNLLRLAFAGVTLYFGSRWLVLGAESAGAALGLQRSVAVMVVLGAGASLPAIGMTALSAINGLGRMVLAQVLMASLANTLLAVGLVSMHSGGVVYRSVMIYGLPSVIALALLLMVLTRSGLARREGGWLLLAFLAWAVALAQV